MISEPVESQHIKKKLFHIFCGTAAIESESQNPISSCVFNVLTPLICFQQ